MCKGFLPIMLKEWLENVNLTTFVQLFSLSARWQ